MVIAGLAGAVIPIALTRLGQDPAQSSTIVLTTVTDVAGFISFLGIAALLSEPAVGGAMRIAKILLAAVAALVVLVVVAVVIFASTFDPNDYKGVATDAFTARTGRALTIDEDLRLAYFPWLAVETGGVTIGSADNVRRRGATVRDRAPRRGARQAAAAPVAPRRDRHRRARRVDAELGPRRGATRQLARPRRRGERARARRTARNPAPQQSRTSRSRASASSTATSTGARTPTSCATA